MSPPRLRLASLFLLVASATASVTGLLTACGASTQPQLKVLAFERPTRASKPAILFVEVVNRDATPMRLQRLEYTFAAAGAHHSAGAIALTRVVEPGGAVVVEVPVPPPEQPWPAGERVTMDGRLYCEQDDLERSFAVTADLPPDSFTR
jgi:hypothetical protein